MFTDMLCNFVGEERVTGAKNVCFGSYLHSCYPCSGKYILLPEGGKNPQALAMFPMNLDSQMTSKGIQGCCLSDAYGTQEVDLVPFDWDPNI